MCHGKNCLGAGLVTVLVGLFAGVAWAATSDTIHDTDNGDGIVFCVSANQPPNNNPAEWECWGSVEYESGDGGGGATHFIFPDDENCEFATFTPMENYEDALVDAQAVIYSYDTSTLQQTELDVSSSATGKFSIIHSPIQSASMGQGTSL